MEPGEALTALEKAQRDFLDLSREFVRAERFQAALKIVLDYSVEKAGAGIFPPGTLDAARATATQTIIHASPVARRYLRLVGSDRMPVDEIPFSKLVELVLSFKGEK